MAIISPSTGDITWEENMSIMHKGWVIKERSDKDENYGYNYDAVPFLSFGRNAGFCGRSVEECKQTIDRNYSQD